MAELLVVGSINMDIINHVSRFPLPGETITGSNIKFSPGGKGANQAVAASLFGSHVTMVGAVGNDVFGSELVATLARYGVDTKNVQTIKGSSGMAFITIDQFAENCIILSVGTNGMILNESIDKAFEDNTNIKAVLLQNEISWKTTEYVINLANLKGLHVYFNPAPALKIPEKLFPLIHTLILNKTEAEQVTGLIIESEDAIENAVHNLMDKGVQRVLLTFGDKGSMFADENRQIYHFPAFHVQAIDTTAAGDTFIGVFASSIESGETVRKSLMFANAAVALAVTKEGALISIPSRNDINIFLKERK